LKNDPNEKLNIAQIKPEIVEKMEGLLKKLRESQTREHDEHLTNEEIKKVKQELRKLGYI